MRKIVLACILLHLTTCAMAQDVSFDNERLAKASTTIGLDLSNFDAGTSIDTVLTVKDMPIGLRLSQGKVVHIGWHLFHLGMREANPLPVYDYLEFACLDHLLSLTENPFVYKNLTFQQGDWKAVQQQVNDTTQCDVSLHNDALYEVVWTLNTGKQIVVNFPVGYERLYMMSRREIENKFVTDIQQFKRTTSQNDASAPADSLLTVQDDVLVLPGDTYQLMLVNRNLYFLKKENIGNVLIFDRQYPAESIANIFVSNDEWLTSYPIEVSFTNHDRKRVTFTITVGQLLSYAAENGCTAYWGHESLSENELKGALFLYNKTYGYDHVFEVTCDPQKIGTAELRFKANCTLFSPTTNVKNIFSNQRGGKTSKKVKL